jgi:hypothetical protein
MNAKVIILILASVVVGVAGTAAVLSARQKSDGADSKANLTKEARKAQLKHEEEVTKLNGKVDTLEKKNKSLLEQRNAANDKAQMVRLKVLVSPKEIISTLPDLYGSNDLFAQRRRIYYTESLVDIGEPSLDEIETFLNKGGDTEPDIMADRRRRMLDRYGITEEQHAQIKTSITTTMEQMKPALDADKERRDGERTKRREEDEKRRNEFRTKMGEFSATLAGLPDEERRQKMREFFEQARGDGESRREQERGDTPRVETVSDKFRATVEANTKVVLGAQQFEAMQKDRTLNRMIGEIGGEDFRRATSGGGREDWRSRLGGGRGGDQGRGRGGR